MIVRNLGIKLASKDIKFNGIRDSVKVLRCVHT